MSYRIGHGAGGNERKRSSHVTQDDPASSNP